MSSFGERLRNIPPVWRVLLILLVAVLLILICLSGILILRGGLAGPATMQTAVAATPTTQAPPVAETPLPLARVDDLVSQAVDQLAQGQITFNPPDQMRAGRQYEIVVRITRNLGEEAKANLEAGLESEGVPRTQVIKVSSEMNVVLTAKEKGDFEITPLSAAQQPIGQLDYTEWKWLVKPLRGGHKTLVLMVSAIIEIPGLTQKTKSLPVLEKEITVAVSPLYSVQVFAGRYWQWLVTAITIPLLGWLWRRYAARKTSSQGQAAPAVEEPGSPVGTQKKMIKILFLAANPSDTTRLRIDEECRAIDAALRRSEYGEVFDIEQHWAVRVSELSGFLLRHQPDIVHFSGHGSPSNEILLEDAEGNSLPVNARALSQLFAVLKDNIKCVVLNACFSKPQAEAIAQHIDCVIGMSEAIGDEAATSFATAFYEALGYGRDIKTAFELGCVQIDLSGLAEQDAPQLIAVNSDPASVVLVKGD